VRHGSRRARFGELVERGKSVELSGVPQPKDPSRWRLIGKRAPRVDTREKLDGRAISASWGYTAVAIGSADRAHSVQSNNSSRSEPARSSKTRTLVQMRVPDSRTPYRSARVDGKGGCPLARLEASVWNMNNVARSKASEQPAR
jgi:hypothetical protein